MDAWIFIYWLAMIVNASFDPYLEGPQGGIWFWSVFGLGIYCIRRQEQLVSAAQSMHRRTPAPAMTQAPQLV
jgi:hypothetical protein